MYRNEAAEHLLRRFLFRENIPVYKNAIDTGTIKHEKSIGEITKFLQTKSAKCRKSLKETEKAEKSLEIKRPLC